MLDLAPFITCTGNLALMIGVLSYADTVGVGVTVDPDLVPDVEAFGEALRWASERSGRRGARDTGPALGSHGPSGLATRPESSQSPGLGGSPR